MAFKLSNRSRVKLEGVNSIARSTTATISGWTPSNLTLDLFDNLNAMFNPFLFL